MLPNPSDTLTHAIATGAVTSPWWLDWLHTTSSYFALLAPILGGIWLAVKIYTTFFDFLLRRKEFRYKYDKTYSKE